MTAILIFCSLLFMLQIASNIVLIIFFKKFTDVSKRSVLNLDKLFEDISDEHI